ncbi:hypothetical protein Tco_1561574 [Tanacetum coccineum]
MSQEEIQQAAREEAWVPKADRVKISTTNMRIDPTMTQKEETYQVILDIIKNTTFYKAFLGSQSPRSRTPISMSLSWQTRSVNLMLRCFARLLTFSQEFKEKNSLTLASVINKFLSGKTTSNDKLRQSRVTIIWGMFYNKYVDFAELIWEDFSYQIDNRQLNKGIREIMSYPRFTKVIINHFLSIHKYVPKALPSSLHTIKDDGVLSRMKFVRFGEVVQKYGRAIPDAMLFDAIKQSKTFKAFISYSIGLVPPKKTRGKDSKGKQPAFTLMIASVEVSDKSESKLANRPTRRRKASGITFRDTLNVLKKKPGDHSQKLKGIKIMTEEEQFATNTMQAIKASKQTLRSQPHAGGTSEGTGISPGVPDKSTIILTSSSEGTGTKPGVPDEVKGASEAKVDSSIDWGSKEESKYYKEENVDKEIEWLNTDEEEEKKDDDDDDISINIEKTNDDEETNDEFINDAEKAEVKKTEEVKGDNKKAKFPPTSSSLSIQSPSILTVPVSVIHEPIFLLPKPEIPTVTSATTHPPPHSVSTISPVLQQTTTPIPTPPITTEAPPVTTVLDLLPIIAQRVPSMVNEYLVSSLGDALQMVLQKHTKELRHEFSQKEVSEIRKIKNEQAEKQQMPKYSVKSSDKVALDENDQKSLLSDEEGIDQGVVNLLKQKKRHHDDQDEDPSAKPNQEELVVKPTEKVNLDATTENVVNDADQPQDDSKPQKDSTTKYDWFKQPQRPPTPDPEWNMCQVVDDHPEQPWFNNILSAAKDPLTFDELMAIPIDFSNIELEYNMEECYKTLSDQLDWNNPKIYRCPFDLSKPLPLKLRLGHLTVASEYFFNKDLEYLKSSDLEKKYTKSITKIKAARYELVGIEYMIPNLWSVAKVGYDKDAERRIKH